MSRVRLVLFIALRQLWDRKLLNSIAMGGVVLGVVVLLAIKGIMHGFQEKFYASILKISPHVTMLDKELRPSASALARFAETFVASRVTHESPSERQLRIARPEEIVRAIEGMDGVVAASGSLVGSAVLALGSKEYSVELRGIDPARQKRVTPIADYVIDGSYQALQTTREGVLIGSGVATRLGAHVDDVILCGSPRGERLSLKVIGVFEAAVPPVDNSRVYVSLKTAQTLLGRPDSVGRVEARLADSARAVQVAARFEKIFGYDAESWQETNANFLGIFQMQDTITNFVVGAILAVGGFGILAIQVMIVLQKTRDIAILRSVGFQRNDILGIFLLQGVVIALAGGAVGDVLGHYLIIALSHLKTHQEGLVKSEYFLVYDDPRVYVYGVAFALLVGVVASLIPAVRGSKVEPVDVLRGQVG
jgi:lipoprotein-releasing system permease protein